MTKEISKEEIYTHVMRLTAIIGRNLKNIRDIAVVPENKPVLSTFIDEAVIELENGLRRHTDASTDISILNKDTYIIFSFDYKIRFAEHIEKQIKSNILLFVVHYVVSRWLSTIEVVKNLSDTYQNSASEYIRILSLLICQRDKYLIKEDEYKMKIKEDEYINSDIDIDSSSMYKLRKKDLQPQRRIWPLGVMESDDKKILTDNDKNILVSKK